jgi:hypothetical protein
METFVQQHPLGGYGVNRYECDVVVRESITSEILAFLVLQQSANFPLRPL